MGNMCVSSLRPFYFLGNATYHHAQKSHARVRTLHFEYACNQSFRPFFRWISCHLPILFGKLYRASNRKQVVPSLCARTRVLSFRSCLPLLLLLQDDVEAAKAALSSASVSIGSMLREGTALDAFLAEHVRRLSSFVCDEAM